MPRPNAPTPGIVLIGGGGHAVVVAEAARAAGFTPLGVYDDAKSCAATSKPDPVPWLGKLTDLGVLSNPWILCIGDLAARAVTLDRLTDAQPPAPAVIHPTAYTSPSASIAPGVFVAPAAVVHSRAHVAAHAIINTAAIIEHDCRIARNCHIAPNVTLAGNVHIGDNTLVGLGAIILPGLHIGAGSTIGAGTVVRADVPDNSRLVGNPARALD